MSGGLYRCDSEGRALGGVFRKDVWWVREKGPGRQKNGEGPPTRNPPFNREARIRGRGQVGDHLHEEQVALRWGGSRHYLPGNGFGHSRNPEALTGAHGDL